MKQRFSRWYFGRNRRKGTLWEDRYRSVAVEIQDLATLGAAARIVSAYIDLNPVRAGMVEDHSPPLTPTLCPQAGVCRLRLGTPRAGRGGRIAGATANQDGPASPKGYAGASKVQDSRTGEMKPRVGIDARKVWEERKRGGRLPMHVMLRLKSRYLVDGAAIASAEFLRRLTGGRPKTASLQDRRQKIAETREANAPEGEQVREPATGKPGVAMRFGQLGGLRVPRDLRVAVVG